jgi:uncharacterized membrane protein YczE
LTKAEAVKRYLFFIIGLSFSSFGIALVTKCGLGTSPISSLPYVLSIIFPFSLGQFTFIINVFMVGGQIIILKKEFQKIQFLQIPMTIIFSLFIDLFMTLLNSFSPVLYPAKIISLLLGCIFIALGISIQIHSNVLILPGEGLVRAISYKLKKEFGTVKTLFDTSLVVISILISIAFLGKIEGLREGTLIAALIVGSISRFFINKLRFLQEIFKGKSVETDTAASYLKN